MAHHTVVTISATNATATLNGSGHLGDVSTLARSVTGTVSIPAKPVGTSLALTAVVTADVVGSKTVSQTIIISAAGAANSPTLANPLLPFAINNGTSANPNLAEQVALPQMAPDPSVAPPQLERIVLTSLRSANAGGSTPFVQRVTGVETIWLTGLLSGIVLSIARINVSRRSLVLSGRPVRQPTGRPRRSRRRTRRLHRLHQLRRYHLRHGRPEL